MSQKSHHSDSQSRSGGKFAKAKTTTAISHPFLTLTSNIINSIRIFNSNASDVEEISPPPEVIEYELCQTGNDEHFHVEKSRKSAWDKRRAKYGYIHQDDAVIEAKLAPIVGSNLKPIEFWAMHFKESEQFNMTFDTFKHKLKIYLKKIDKKLSSMQLKRVRFSDTDSPPYLQFYVDLQRELHLTNPNEVLNRSDFYEKYVLVPPYDRVPSFEYFTKRLSSIMKEQSLSIDNDEPAETMVSGEHRDDINRANCGDPEAADHLADLQGVKNIDDVTGIDACNEHRDNDNHSSGANSHDTANGMKNTDDDAFGYHPVDDDHAIADHSHHDSPTKMSTLTNSSKTSIQNIKKKVFDKSVQYHPRTEKIYKEISKTTGAVGGEGGGGPISNSRVSTINSFAISSTSNNSQIATSNTITATNSNVATTSTTR